MGTTEKLKEVLHRMQSNEPGLHTKIIEPYKLVRLSTLPVLLKDLVASEIKRKKFKIIKKRGGILILKRPT